MDICVLTVEGKKNSLPYSSKATHMSEIFKSKFNGMKFRYSLECCKI